MYCRILFILFLCRELFYIVILTDEFPVDTITVINLFVTQN